MERYFLMLYNPNKTYLENAEEGPFYKGEFPERKEVEGAKFLDFELLSPIGVPAGPLLNSRWISLASKLGYDVLTYKTIRMHEHPSHPLPNIAYVNTNGTLTPGNLPEYVERTSDFKSLQELAITNSFGNPSRSQKYLEEDIPKAKACLKKGQLLIVSVFGTTKEEYVETARLAKMWGAPVVEANFSCPNVGKSEGSLYTNAESVYAIASKMVQALRSTPLVIKVGVFPSPIQMRAVLIAAARAGVRAVSGINTISMKVSPRLDKNRETCGICGYPIHEAALQFVTDAYRIINEERLDLEITATGGAVLPEHLQNFLDRGAKVAMTATGMMWDPLLGAKFHQQAGVHAG
jgi:dihydroorotate dehydrogenase